MKHTPRHIQQAYCCTVGALPSVSLPCSTLVWPFLTRRIRLTTLGYCSTLLQVGYLWAERVEASLEEEQTHRVQDGAHASLHSVTKGCTTASLLNLRTVVALGCMLPSGAPLPPVALQPLSRTRLGPFLMPLLLSFPCVPVSLR